MLYLLLAIFSSALVSITMRLSEGKISGNASMLAVNYLMCLLLAGMHTGFDALLPTSGKMTLTVVFSFINGLLYLLGFVLLQLNVKRNGVVLSATFMKLGLLVPMAVSICFFGESPTLLQAVGFLLAVAAIILVNTRTNEDYGSFGFGLILLLLAGGGGDAMAKVFEEQGDPAHSEQFLLYTFVFALLLCLLLVLWRKERPGVAELGYGLLVGIPNYYSARFLLLSLDKVEAVIVYPTYSVATIALVSLAGVCFFKEKLSRRQRLAIAVIPLALVVLNI